MNIAVVDAVGRALPGASVAVGQAGPVTVDAAGRLAVPDPASSTTYAVTHPLLHDISVSVQPDGQGWIWDDPGSGVVPGSPPTLTVRLSAVAPAPTEQRSEQELAYDAKRGRPSRPNGILLGPDQRYRGLFDGHYRFHLAGPALLGNAAGDGWARLADTAVERVDPSARGQFAFLEWGGLAGAPRLLVGVWAPWPSGPVALEPTSEAVVYYTPTTSAERGYPVDAPPYRGEYPYGLTTDAKTKTWGQPYPGLVQRHLLHEKFLVYQLIGAGRRAAVICPVQPAAAWRAFATRAGLGRLVNEVLLWFHRLQSPLLSYPPRSETPDPTFRRTRLGAWRPPPQLRSVVGSGFSAGVGALIELMGTATLPGGFPDVVFGSDESVLSRVWRELWDFDGPRNMIGTTEAWESKLVAWRQDRRIVRLYHSDYTGWSAEDIGKLDALLPKAPTIRATAKDRAASYRASATNGSAAAFNTPYLYDGPAGSDWQQDPRPERAPDRPDHWNLRGDTPGATVHQIVPIVCYGHAAGLSTPPKAQ